MVQCEKHKFCHIPRYILRAWQWYILEGYILRAWWWYIPPRYILRAWKWHIPRMLGI